MKTSWFHDALTASVAELGPRPSAALGLLRSLPLRAIRSNVAQGLAYAGTRGRDLWRHQSEATEAIRTHLLDEANEPTAIVVMPTGSGKTEVILRTVEASGLDVEDVRIAVPTIVLTPTRQLVDQTLKAFQQRFPNLHVASLGEGSMRPASVTVMTYDLFVDMVSDGRLASDDVQALVMDEAHRGLSELRQDIIGRMMRNVVLTAYSATPAFDSIKNVHALLGAKNEVLRVSDERMRREGIISPVIDYVLHVDIQGQFPEDRVSRGEIIRMACQNAVLDFVASYQEDMTGIILSEKTYLAFTNGIERAHGLAVEMSRNGMPAQAVSGRDGIDAIGKVIDRLASGGIQAIVNDQVLMEGTDIPEARGILAFSPTTSLVRHLQRCGRARRIDPRYPLSDVRQVTSVVETVVTLNAVPLTGQIIYADAIGDLGVVRVVEGPAQSVDDLAEQLSGGSRHRSRLRGPAQANEGPALEGGWVVSSNDLASVHYLLADRDLTPAPDGYVPWGAIPRTLLVSHHNEALVAALRDLERSLRAGEPTLVGGIPVRAGLHVMASGHRGICIHQEDIEAFRAVVGSADRIEPWSEGWMPVNVVAERIGTNRSNARFRELWDQALAGVLPVPAAPDGGPGIRLMRHHSHRIGYAHPSALASFADAFGSTEKLLYQKKGEGLIPYTTLCRMHKVAVHNKDFRAAWSELVEMHKSNAQTEIDAVPVKFGLYRTATNALAYCIGSESVPAFLKKAGYEADREPLPSKPDDWMTKEEAATMLSAGAGDTAAELSGLDRLWQMLALSKGTSNKLRGSWGGARFAGGGRGNGVFCIPKSKLPELHRMLLGEDVSPMTSEWLTLGAVGRAHASAGPLKNHLKAAWRRLEAEYAKDAGCLPYRMAYKTRVSSRYFCMHVGDVPSFVRHERGVLDEAVAGEGWLTKSDVEELLVNAFRSASFHEAWDLLKACAAEGPVMDGEREVAFALKARRSKVWCLHEEELPWFAALCGLALRDAGIPDRGEDWLSKSDTAKALGVITTDQRFGPAWQALADQIADGRKPMIDGEPCQFELRQGVYRVLPYLHLASLSAFADGIGKTVRHPPEGWVSSLVEETTMPGMRV